MNLTEEQAEASYNLSKDAIETVNDQIRKQEEEKKKKEAENASPESNAEEPAAGQEGKTGETADPAEAGAADADETGDGQILTFEWRPEETVLAELLAAS